MAGFKNVHLMSEPLAAAIEYGYRQSYAQTLLVYDLGGGTFDACVLQVAVDENGQEIFQELSDVGDMNLGGDDFDAELVRWMKAAFTEQTGVDLDALETAERKRVMQKLKQEAEQTKKKLSGTNKVSVRVNPLVIVDGVPKNLNIEITREEFEAMIRKYVDRSRDIIEEALKRAGKHTDEISKVVLVGGSTLIPMVRRMVAGYLKEPYRATDPAKSVAMGASIYNYLIHLPDSQAQVRVGQITRQVFGTEAVTNIVTMERQAIPIIPMGSPIPSRFSDSNFASMSGASRVNVDVYQWEQGQEEARRYIGTVALSGLTGATQLEITYAIDENNIFEVYVKDLATGRTERAEFDRTNTSAPPPREVHTGSDKVNIVFLIDTTGSMDTYINGVKDRAIEFSNILASKGAAYKLGLIGFGDLGENEKPSVYNFTDDVPKFQKQVKNIPRTYGGDIPESSLDALETGVELLKSHRDDGGRNIFILITDAPPHVPTMSGKSVAQICQMLDERGVTTYVVARKDRESIDAYDPLTKPNGKFYDLNDKFFDILDNIAMSIAELIRL